ncbi:MAG TPA: zf-HC2 domain-containing protein [Terriglobales bacterium]|nr:zf-HC2 domain-containing protein [Terriglobales bacterium]
MSGESKLGMQCAEFEVLLSDQLDGLLSESDEQRFQAHLAACQSCAPMYNEVHAGLAWLSALKEDEVEPPAEMVTNILRATVGISPIPQAAKPEKSWWERLKETPALAPFFQTVLQPRFAMGFGMAFFSITMLLNLSGVKVKNIRYIDLSPSAIVTAYGETTGKIVSYWENIRFVLEIESRVRDLKKATTPKQNSGPKTDGKDQQKEQNRETSGVTNQEPDLSRSEGRQILAKAAANTDVPHGQASRQRRLS